MCHHVSLQCQGQNDIQLLPLSETSGRGQMSVSESWSLRCATAKSESALQVGAPTALGGMGLCRIASHGKLKKGSARGVKRQLQDLFAFRSLDKLHPHRDIDASTRSLVPSLLFALLASVLTIIEQSKHRRETHTEPKLRNEQTAGSMQSKQQILSLACVPKIQESRIMEIRTMDSHYVGWPPVSTQKTDKQTDSQAGRQAGRTDRQTDTQHTDTHTHTHTHKKKTKNDPMPPKTALGHGKSASWSQLGGMPITLR